MGYVGFPVAATILQAGFRVVGFDADEARVARLDDGCSYLGHVATSQFRTLAQSDRFSASASAESLKACDVVILCVPTPLQEDRSPDLSHVVAATTMVERILHPGMLVVLESTTYPGTTREVMLPILEQHGLRSGSDYFLAYSPERENPADPIFDMKSIPKVVGGVDEVSAELACMLYGSIVDEVVPVASSEIAEASKILENVYRCVNIALVNELKVAFEKMGVDIWQVLEASATKPFGFHAFWPGPGLGGHCIPIDPFYLASRAREVGGETRFIELAGEINATMPRLVGQTVCRELEQDGVPVETANVLVVGVAYKPNVSDTRETPAVPIIGMLQDRGCEVRYHDPNCPEFAAPEHAIDLRSVPLDQSLLAAADAVVVVTDHDGVDWDQVGRYASLIVDTRNALAGVDVSGRLVKA
jgi:UDP-N-acetyl-D-glucosamine dehydrogenase